MRTEKMAKIFDAAKGCHFKGRQILFDTNVWIAIDGADPRPHQAPYSDFFGQVLSSDNQLITNDYVMSEYFNRACKIQHKIKFGDDVENFKKRRRAGEFAEYLEEIKFSCLDILKDCTFDNAVTAACSIDGFVAEAALGQLDLSDVVIREHCRRKNYVLVTDDSDYLGCGLDVVTCNPWLLSKAHTHN